MSFTDRTGKADRLLQLVTAHYWNAATIKQQYRIFHEPYGYETHISAQAQDVLKRIYTKTAKHIRFTPDYVVGQAGSRAPEPVVLMEYKVTTTPRYTLRDLQWDSGQIEADAWDNYMNLTSSGLRVAILVYCPYHARPLLCDFPNNDWLTQARSVVQQSQTGSRTDYCNISLPKIRTFMDFMDAEFSVPVDTSIPLVKSVLDLAKTDPLLAITHANASAYKDKVAGFNWIKI